VIILAKLNGNDDLIGIGTYVSSPLCWAASTGNNRGEIQKIDDLKDPKFGISRFSSGSHIMALYLAHLRGWNPNNMEFKVHQNLSGLANGVTSEDSDLFLWDHFTTKVLFIKLNFITQIIYPIIGNF
jgi:ABC-type nitrate/sulfonate/bicarbonate transport system substrate-binding protein